MGITNSVLTHEAKIVRTFRGLRALKQHQRSLGAAQSRLGLEDSVLCQLAIALGRAKELGASQASGTASYMTRLNTKAEVDNLIFLVKNLAKTGPAKPPSGGHRVQVSLGRFVDTNHTAREMFEDTDALGGLQALSDTMGTNDVSGIRNAVSRLESAFGSVQHVVGDLEARMTQLDAAIVTLPPVPFASVHPIR